MPVFLLMDPATTSKFLIKIYFRQLLPAIILIAVAYLLKYYFKLSETEPVPSLLVSVVITTLAGVVGIAAPIFFRSYFVYKNRDKKKILPDDFLGFERVLLTTALISPYFLVISVLINMNETANMLITIFALYALYYYFPTEKKIRFEMRIFRIKPTNQ